MRSNVRRREDRKPQVEEENHAPGWMITFGDMMALLLTFFVLIVSFSSIQLVEFQKAMGSLKGALGVLPHHQSPIKASAMKIPAFSGFNQRKLNMDFKDMIKFIESEGLEDYVKVEILEDAVSIRMSEPVLFALGRAELKSTISPLLSKIGNLAREWPNKIRVEGHTDNLPISNDEFPSNWELSAIRAINVLHFFEQNCQVSPKKLYSIGHGENRPLVENDSNNNRAKNRRVEIFLER